MKIELPITLTVQEEYAIDRFVAKLDTWLPAAERLERLKRLLADRSNLAPSAHPPR